VNALPLHRRRCRAAAAAAVSVVGCRETRERSDTRETVRRLLEGRLMEPLVADHLKLP
jgi:hypothetical protein